MYKIKNILKVKKDENINKQIKSSLLLEFIEEVKDEGYEILDYNYLSNINGYCSLVATVGYWEEDKC